MFFFGLIFVFQSQLTSINNQQFLINCPNPLNNQIALIDSISNNQVNYHITNFGNGTNSDSGTYFECFIDQNTHLQGAFSKIKPYGATLFSAIPYGWYAWVGDTISVYIGKTSPTIALIADYINAPAQVTGIVWFTYVQAMLLGFIGLGIFLAVRGV